MYSSTQQIDDRWDDNFAKSDAIRERYASEINQLKEYEESERWWYEYMQKVYEAGFDEDHDAYEDTWKRTLQHYQSLGY